MALTILPFFLYGLARVYEHSAEHLHVDTAIEHLDLTVIRQSGMALETSAPHLPLAETLACCPEDAFG